MRQAFAAGGQHAKTTALAQEQVKNRQIPFPCVARQPFRAVEFRLRDAYRFDLGKLFQSRNQVLTDGGIVFNNIRTQFHSVVQVVGGGCADSGSHGGWRGSPHFVWTPIGSFCQ
ncbi:hypothetical protein D3C86_1947540 [compost metagenome]